MSDQKILRLADLLSARNLAQRELSDTSALARAPIFPLLPEGFSTRSTANWLNAAISNRIHSLKNRVDDLNASINNEGYNNDDSRERARKQDDNVLILGGKRYNIRPITPGDEPRNIVLGIVEEDKPE